MLLEAFGALALFRLLGRQESLADAALRFGLVGIVFSWGVFIVQLGTRHMVVHITQHGIGSGTAQEMQAQLQDFAVAVYSAGGALHVAFLSVSSVASVLLGLGLASRFGAMSIFKAAAYGLVLVGALSLLNLVIAQHIHGIDIGLLALIINGILMIGAVCYFILGLGMYQGRSELVPEDAPGG